MKASTQIFLAVRNIGDAQDTGKIHEGSLSESILWMAKQLAEMSMAGRIVIGIGRNQQDALRGIQVKSMGKNRIDEDMQSLLESVFSGDMTADDALNHQAQLTGKSIEPIAGDDYVA